ncbi:hypothetical protein E2562_005275 [Oryza meyeriana var. granulata]|uniref:Uncharacterized protein n=1 Tax=Oryza meyeriana var. granulata TaxID=110450 RepID=A0A6G1EFW9_9ORYZ|nr:hypothetical protein E2562_005275 [Oryza meyeriana var. granulata]
MASSNNGYDEQQHQGTTTVPDERLALAGFALDINAPPTVPLCRTLQSHHAGPGGIMGVCVVILVLCRGVAGGITSHRQHIQVQGGADEMALAKQYK